MEGIISTKWTEVPNSIKTHYLVAAEEMTVLYYYRGNDTRVTTIRMDKS